MEGGTLSVAVGDYPHTAALKRGEVRSPSLDLAFAEVRPVNRAFAPMVRDGRYDICELAIATVLQAKARGKPLVLLPVVLAARFQEGALLCRADGAIDGPASLAGRRVGVRAYSQTTGMWLRGILAEGWGVRARDVAWVTFEGAHVEEAKDPHWVTRAAPGQDMMAMLHAGELDAVIVGNDVPADPRLGTVFPDPEAAGAALGRAWGFMPVNHLLTIRREVAERRPEVVAELLRLFGASAALATAPFPVVRTPADLAPCLERAIRYCREQDMLPGPLGLDEVWAGFVS